jgi:hypothetical protein
MFTAYEKDLPLVHERKVVRVRVESLPGEPIHARVGFILNPAMGGADVAQRRRDAKRCASVRTHPVGERLLVCICICFAPLRLCATSHRRI